MTYTKSYTGCLKPTVCFRNLMNYTTRWGVLHLAERYQYTRQSVPGKYRLIIELLFATEQVSVVLIQHKSMQQKKPHSLKRPGKFLRQKTKYSTWIGIHKATKTIVKYKCDKHCFRTLPRSFNLLLQQRCSTTLTKKITKFSSGAIAKEILALPMHTFSIPNAYFSPPNAYNNNNTW